MLSLIAAAAMAQQTGSMATGTGSAKQAKEETTVGSVPASPLSLDDCRNMAMSYNKGMAMKRTEREMAKMLKKAARTKYLPHLNVMGGAIFSSREISLLTNKQKSTLNNLGTGVGSILGVSDPKVTGTLNAMGQSVTDAFHTNTRAMYMATAMVTQPIYMGGAITAANNIADINMTMAANKEELERQNTLQNIDQTYWTVVSLRHKQKLAQSYLNLVKKLDDDVAKMIKEGVATRADGLKVNVKVNEAEMAVTQVDDGVALAKMLLCQTCGLPLDAQVTLADEESETLNISGDATATAPVGTIDRPETRLLQDAIDMSVQATKLVRSAFLPQVMAAGGYLLTNPNVYDGFNRKFAGVWNIGVVVRVPVWNWFEGTYKVRAAKAATAIAKLELSEAQEKIDLQVSQCNFKLNEATKKYAMATKNVEKAEENLRCANVGFKEGVLQTTDVMTAQTAWMQAKSQQIDAEVDVKLSQVNLKKALGTL